MTYLLHCTTEAGEPVRLSYDPHTSELLNPAGESLISEAAPDLFDRAERISPEQPGRKSAKPASLKIQLGLQCNYSCSYCNQASSVESATVSRTADADEFLAGMDAWLESAPSQIEFWGGEPFLYFAKLKRLVPALSQKFPEANMLIVTNGSLLDGEIIDFIERYDLEIAISHDGPGQHLRGPDPLADAQRAKWIKALLAARAPLRRIAFNVVLSPANDDIVATRAWFVERLGEENVYLTTEGVVSTYDEPAMNGSGHWPRGDYSRLRDSLVRGFETGDALRYGAILEKSRDFIDSLKHLRPSSALGQKCGMDRADQLAVDLKGNVMTCQNTGAKGKHGIGTVANLEAVRLDTAYHWSHRDTCNHCPVLQLCKGSCMFLEDDLFAQSCENEYHYNMAILAGILKRVAGLNLLRIEGDIRRPVRRKIIPVAIQKQMPA